MRIVITGSTKIGRINKVGSVRAEFSNAYINASAIKLKEPESTAKIDEVADEFMMAVSGAIKTVGFKEDDLKDHQQPRHHSKQKRLPDMAIHRSDHNSHHHAESQGP